MLKVLRFLTRKQAPKPCKDIICLLLKLKQLSIRVNWVFGCLGEILIRPWGSVGVSISVILALKEVSSSVAVNLDLYNP
jgi:hypothetical protein